MKRLNKKYTLRQENLQSYNAYVNCYCDCDDNCKGTSIFHNPFRGAQRHTQLILNRIG